MSRTTRLTTKAMRLERTRAERVGYISGLDDLGLAVVGDED